MKFISTHPSLVLHLNRWATGSQLLFATFYFWDPGATIQKSLVGLLMSILHQLLSQRPDLLENIATRRRLLFAVAGTDTQSPPWGFVELRECLRRLAAMVEGEARLALLSMA